MDYKKTILIITLSVIAVVVAFLVIGGLGSTIVNSSNAMAYPNNCSEGLADSTLVVFNSSNSQCYFLNATRDVTNIQSAKLYSLPLSGLFTPTGVVIIILMVALFIAIALFILKGIKGK